LSDGFPAHGRPLLPLFLLRAAILSAGTVTAAGVEELENPRKKNMSLFTVPSAEYFLPMI